MADGQREAAAALAGPGMQITEAGLPSPLLLQAGLGSNRRPPSRLPHPPPLCSSVGSALRLPGLCGETGGRDLETHPKSGDDSDAPALFQQQFPWSHLPR